MLVDTQTILTIKPQNNPVNAVDWFPINIARAITAAKWEIPASPNIFAGLPLFSEL